MKLKKLFLSMIITLMVLVIGTSLVNASASEETVQEESVETLPEEPSFGTLEECVSYYQSNLEKYTKSLASTQTSEVAVKLYAIMAEGKNVLADAPTQQLVKTFYDLYLEKLANVIEEEEIAQAKKDGIAKIYDAIAEEATKVEDALYDEYGYELEIATCDISSYILLIQNATTEDEAKAIAEEAEVLHKRVHTLQDLRPSSLLHEKVRHLPYLLQRTRIQGRDPRRKEGKLVISEKQR